MEKFPVFFRSVSVSVPVRCRVFFPFLFRSGFFPFPFSVSSKITCLRSIESARSARRPPSCVCEYMYTRYRYSARYYANNRSTTMVFSDYAKLRIVFTERQLARDSGLSELARCRYVHNPHARTHRVAAVSTPLKLVSAWLQDNCPRSWTSPSA